MRVSGIEQFAGAVQTFEVGQDPNTKDIGLDDIDNGFYIAIN